MIINISKSSLYIVCCHDASNNYQNALTACPLRKSASAYGGKVCAVMIGNQISSSSKTEIFTQDYKILRSLTPLESSRLKTWRCRWIITPMRWLIGQHYFLQLTNSRTEKNYTFPFLPEYWGDPTPYESDYKWILN